MHRIAIAVAIVVLVSSAVRAGWDVEFEIASATHEPALNGTDRSKSSDDPLTIYWNVKGIEEDPEAFESNSRCSAASPEQNKLKRESAQFAKNLWPLTPRINEPSSEPDVRGELAKALWPRTFSYLKPRDSEETWTFEGLIYFTR